MNKLIALVVILVTTALAATPALAETQLPSGGGGGKNIVIAMNHTNGRLSVRARLQVNREPGPNVQPVNLALATSSCVDCQTLVIALQLNVAGTHASLVAPRNAAVATNAGCLRCRTVARAVQYLFTVPNPLAGTPPVVDPIFRSVERTLRDIETDRSITVEEAEARLDAAVAVFSAEAMTYANSRDAADAP